ncbi:MAG: hypothetical protein E6Q97_30905 [Desulfurellales bacterium]|nr:MAG: hypothetical protein E6Q97_30905 [Desulfurellales bacterium]
MKIEVREVQVAPPPKEYVLTLSAPEVKVVRYCLYMADSRRLRGDEYEIASDLHRLLRQAMAQTGDWKGEGVDFR